MHLIVRTAWALAIAPIAGGAAGLFIYLCYSLATDPSQGLLTDFWDSLRFSLTGGAFYGGMFGVLPSFIVGWPLHLVLQRIHMTGWWAYVALGIGLSAIAGFIVAPLFGLSPTYLDTELRVMLFTCGAIGGLVFWFIRRPDRDAISTTPQPHLPQ